jgi:hypothetical protein
MPENNHAEFKENFVDYNHVRDRQITAVVPDIKINQVPQWLLNLTEDDIKNKPFPLKKFLSDSCYYPGCGTDGNPVAFFGRYCQSFIYVDHGVTEAKVLDDIKKTSFTGYKILARRNLTPEELCPDLKGISVNTKEGYAVWLVLERAADKTDDFGPQRLNIVFLGAEAGPAYQVIYLRNGFIPKCLAIVQCSELRDDQVFQRLVLANPPQFMFSGRHGTDASPTTSWCGYKRNIFGIPLSYKRYDLWIHNSVPQKPQRKIYNTIICHRSGYRDFHWGFDGNTIITMTRNDGNTPGCLHVYNQNQQERVWDFVLKHNNIVNSKDVDNHLYGRSLGKYARRFRRIMLQCGIWHKKNKSISSICQDVEDYKTKLRQYFNDTLNNSHNDNVMDK